MATIYSVLIGEGNSESGGIVLLPAIPPTYVYIVRDIDVVYTGTSAEAATSSIAFVDSAGVSLFSLAGGALQPGQWYGWRGRQVLEPGDTLTALVVNPVFSFRVSGYQLTAP